MSYNWNAELRDVCTDLKIPYTIEYMDTESKDFKIVCIYPEHKKQILEWLNSERQEVTDSADLEWFDQVQKLVELV